MATLTLDDLALLQEHTCFTIEILRLAPYEMPVPLPRARRGKKRAVSEKLRALIRELADQGLVEIEETQGLYRCTEQGEQVRLAYLRFSYGVR